MAKQQIGVIVAGAYGRMGREVVKAVSAASGMRVTGGIDKTGMGVDAGVAAGIASLRAPITDDLRQLLKCVPAQVMVDFTIAEGFLPRARIALNAGLRLVVGTTGIPEAELKKVEKLATAKKLGVIVAPNFAIGAVLMMKFAALAAAYMPHVEIIEMHHDKKLDAPSGTALYTAALIAEAKKQLPRRKDPTTTVKLTGARGGLLDDISVHSVRLPGYLAHQEVLFGGPGQTLSLRHDTTSREAFMPGVVLAVRKVIKLNGYVCGLEHVV